MTVKKFFFCNNVKWQMFTRLIAVIILQWIQISNHGRHQNAYKLKCQLYLSLKKGNCNSKLRKLIPKDKKTPNPWQWRGTLPGPTHTGVGILRSVCAVGGAYLMGRKMFIVGLGAPQLGLLFHCWPDSGQSLIHRPWTLHAVTDDCSGKRPKYSPKTRIQVATTFALVCCFYHHHYYYGSNTYYLPHSVRGVKCYPRSIVFNPYNHLTK